MQPPLVTALSPSSLHVSWSEPTSPNGVIQWYHLNQTGVGTILTHTDGPRNYTVTGKIHVLSFCYYLPTSPSLFLHSSTLSLVSLFLPLYSLLCFISFSLPLSFSCSFPPLLSPFLSFPPLLNYTVSFFPVLSLPNSLPLCSHLANLLLNLSLFLCHALIYVSWSLEAI